MVDAAGGDPLDPERPGFTDGHGAFCQTLPQDTQRDSRNGFRQVTVGFHLSLASGAVGCAGLGMPAAEQDRLPPRVVHQQMGGGMAHDDQPVPRAGGPLHRAPMDGAAGNRDAAGDLLLDQPEVPVLHQPGDDAVVGQGLELGARVGCVAVALHHRHVLVVAVVALERAGLERFEEHGAAGGEAGAIPLAQLGAVPLLEVGHPHQGVGVGAVAGTGEGFRLPASGLRRHGAPQPPERPTLHQRFGFMVHQALQCRLQPGPVKLQRRIEVRHVVVGGDGAAHRNTPRRPGVRAC